MITVSIKFALLCVVICIQLYVCMASESIEVNSHEWNCTRPWPQMTIFTPVKNTGKKNNRYYETETFFLFPLILFWPLKTSNTSVVITIDEESMNHVHTNMVRSTVSSSKHYFPGGISVNYVSSPYKFNPKTNLRGQWQMFWADNFTDSTFIAYCHSDATLITYVNREDLFEGDKPILIGKYGHEESKILTTTASTTYNILGLLQPMLSMAILPMIIKREHVQGLRKYIEARSGKSFDEIFLNNMYGHISFSNIIGTYVYHLHRDEYVWFFNSLTSDWDGVNPPPVRGIDGNVSQYTPEMKRNKPRIMTHGRHRVLNPSTLHTILDHTKCGVYVLGVHNMPQFLREGYCRAPPFPKTDLYCSRVDPRRFYYEMHNFEYADYVLHSPVESLNSEMARRYEHIKTCELEVDYKILNIMASLNVEN